MKPITYIIVVCTTVLFNLAYIAQSDSQQNEKSPEKKTNVNVSQRNTSEKMQVLPASEKKRMKIESQNTRTENTQTEMVDGRPVTIDQQGIQRLLNPDFVNATPVKKSD